MALGTQAQRDSFDRIFEHMGAMVDDVLNHNFFRSSGAQTWSPALNIYEMSDRYVICVELAGMKHEQIDVRAEEQVLHIQGERPKPCVRDCHEHVSVHLMEIDSGRFHRRVPLPGDVDQDAIEACYRNGYLWVTVPRLVSQVDQAEQ